MAPVDTKTILDPSAAPTLFVAPTPVIDAVKLPPAATPAKPWLDERKTVPTRVIPTVFERAPKTKRWPVVVASALAAGAAMLTVLVLWRLLGA